MKSLRGLAWGVVVGIRGVVPLEAAVAPALQIEPSGDTYVIRFDGSLEVADDPAGPYAPAEGATSPYFVKGGIRTRYWRAVVGEGPVIRALVAGANHTLVIGSGGTLRGWGQNMGGQLGAGYFSATPPYGISQPIPAAPPARAWRAVSAGSFHTLAIQDGDGSLWGWGSSAYGQLGLGDEYGHNLGQPIAAGFSWRHVAAGGNHSLAVRSDGTLWSWGNNDEGQVGNGLVTIPSPISVTHGVVSPYHVGTASNWVAVYAGPSHSLAVDQDGALWAWGGNSGGQLGYATTRPAAVPERVAIPSAVKTVSAGLRHTLALGVDGTLWAWGANDSGQIGRGTNTTYSTVPAIFGTGQRWLAIAAGADHTVAVRSDGTLWGCGRNDSGQLGPIATNRVYGLRRIEPSSTWCAVAAGDRHTVALRSDRSLWAWGDNQWGQLGDGTLESSKVPRRIADTSDW